MHRATETARARFDRRLKEFERLVEVLQTSATVQLMLIDVAHHLWQNEGVPVPRETITALNVLQKGLKVLEKQTSVTLAIISGIRIVKAICDEIDIDSEIKAWQSIVEFLKNDLYDCKGEQAEKVLESLIFAREMLENAKDCKRNPGKKTILTTLCVGAEWGGGVAGGLVGAKTGATVGLVGGPIGGIVGATTGALLGAAFGSEFCASAVENFRVDEDGLATEMQGSVIKAGIGSVMPCDANFFVGKGAEVGARTSIARVHLDDSASVDFGKVGASVGISNKGVELGVESKPLWFEGDLEPFKIGAGFHMDTGVEFSSNKVSVNFLGFGFSIGKGSFGLSSPLLSFTKK